MCFSKIRRNLLISNVVTASLTSCNTCSNNFSFFKSPYKFA